MTAAKQEMGAGAAYKAAIAKKEVEIVSVTVPSGQVFQFRKPGVFGTLFGIGSLPQTATSSAVDEWIKQGVLTVGDDEGSLSADAAKNLSMGMAVVDRVIHLSYKPKLVSGSAQNDNELSTSDVDEDDLAYLFRWVSAGGDLSAMLSTFSQGPHTDPLAIARRKKQRHKA